MTTKPLTVTLPSDCEVLVTREFAAPRKLVWDAHTKPELVKRWMLGPEGWSMPVCDMDVRPGGTYRWGWKNEADGKRFGFHGAFREVEAPARIVHTEFFDPGDIADNTFPDGDPALITLELSQRDGRTLLISRMLFPSKQARDGAVATGMTDGMEMSYARLDELLVSEG